MVLLGYEFQRNLDWDVILHPEDIHKLQEHLKVISGSDEIGINEELRLIHKSGEILWMEVHIYFKPQPDQDREFIFMAFKNISKKKNAELELIHRHNRAHEILNDSSIGTWECNLVTGESICNENLAAIIGYSVEELNSSAIDIWAALTHPEDFEKLQKLVDEHLNSKSPSFISECRMKHRNGHWIWVTKIGKVISYTKNNQPEVLEGILYDITDRRKSNV